MEAYAWCNITAAQGYKNAEKTEQRIAESMTHKKNRPRTETCAWVPGRLRAAAQKHTK